MNAYAKLAERFERLGVLGDTLGILHWDTATTMPQGAADARGAQVSTLHVLRHELLTDPRVGDWVEDAEAAGESDPWKRANLREMRRRRHHHRSPIR